MNVFKKIVSKGAVIYTAGSLCILLFSLSVPENTMDKLLLPTPFLMFAAYAFVLALGDLPYHVGKCSPVAARAIHATCYNLGFFCFMLLCNMSFSTSVIATVIFALFYTAAVVLAGVFRKKNKLAPAKNTETSVKGKNSKSKSKPQSSYTNRFS